MSTKRTPLKKRPAPSRGASAPRTKKAPPPRRGGFPRVFYGAIAALVVLVGALMAANLVQDSALSASAHHVAATADFDVYSLKRDVRLGDDGSKRPDTIRGDTLTGKGDSTVVYSAPRIQEYVALPRFLAVVTLNDDNTSNLDIVSLAKGTLSRVRLPASGRVENLRASTSKQLIGYSFTSADPSAAVWKSLYVLDVTAPAHAPRELLGIDGKPIPAWKLDFVPGTASLVAQTDDKLVFLIDAGGSDKVTALGHHGEMRGFIPGTTRLVVAERDADSTVDLADGTVTPLDLRHSTRSATSYTGQTVVLNGSGRYALVISNYNQGKEDSVITVTDADGTKMLYQPNPAWSRIGNVCASPDGRYLAVETISTAGVSDKYQNLPAFSPSRTTLVDLTTGKDARNLAGFLPNWCR